MDALISAEKKDCNCPKHKQWEKAPNGKRQCCAYSKRSKKRCKKDPVIGGDYCHIHGGKEQTAQLGVNNPNFKHGKYSRYHDALPAHMRDAHEQLRGSADLLDQTDAIAMLTQLVNKSIGDLLSDDVPDMQALKIAWDKLDEAMLRKDGTAPLRKQELHELITNGAAHTGKQDKMLKLIDALRKMTDTQVKSLAQSKKVVPVTQYRLALTLLYGAIVTALQQHAVNHPDIVKSVLRAVTVEGKRLGIVQ